MILDFLKAGRTVYADINGINIDGVIQIDKTTHDWRTTPDSSVVVYDEVQQSEVFKKGSGTLSNNPIIQGLETHRHTGHDIIIITQDPNFIHTHVLKLVGEHFHLHRPFGAKVARIFMWRVGEKNPNTPSVQARSEDKKLFNYDKKLYSYYTSSSDHNLKLKIPRSVYTFVIIFLLILAAVIYNFSKSHLLMSAAKLDTPTQTQTAEKSSSNLKTMSLNNQPTTHVREWFSDDMPPVASCYVSFPVDPMGCLCKSFDDLVLNLSTSECYNVATNPSRWQSRPREINTDMHHEEQIKTSAKLDAVKI